MVDSARLILYEEHPERVFRDIKHLSEEEYLEAKEASKTLFQLNDSQNRYNAVYSAFVRYADVVVETEEKLSEPGHPDVATLKRDLNERFSIYLHSVRAFLDHSLKELSDLYGKDSAACEAFKSATNEVYDGRFSYRLLDQVRNYTQHVGEAIDNVSFGWRALDKEKKTSEPYLEVSLSRESLLAWSGLKASFRPELAKQDEKIPVLPQVQEVTGCIKYLNTVFLIQRMADVKEAARHLKTLTKPIGETQGYIAVGFMDFSQVPEDGTTTGPMNLQLSWLPMPLVDRVLEASAGSENHHSQ